jgi:hypothetical protein
LQSIKVHSSVSNSAAVRIKKKRKMREDINKSGVDTTTVDKYESASQQKKSKPNDTSFAFIAAGLGPDGDSEKERARRVRRLSIMTGITVLALTACYWIMPLNVESVRRATKTIANISNISDNGWDKGDTQREDPTTATGTGVDMCPINSLIVNPSVQVIENQSLYLENNSLVENNAEQNMVELKPMFSKPALSVVWKSSIMKIIGNPMMVQKIDPVKLLQAVGNFFKEELSKIQAFVSIFKFDGKRRITN